ncbi:hypothetical protein DW785_03050 [Bacteroides xylanisolvens]|nr:hypothetical protein DW785_03050 [Bacteroides xylanisolvens]
MLQILYLQRICNRYLQRSNCLFPKTLQAFCCRWQILQCFFNFMEEGIYHNYAHNCKTVG